MTPDEVRAIFRAIAHMEGKRLACVPQEDRAWLMHFAWSVVKANDENFKVIWPAALHLLAKYQLQ